MAPDEHKTPSKKDRMFLFQVDSVPIISLLIKIHQFSYFSGLLYKCKQSEFRQDRESSISQYEWRFGN